MPKKINLDEDFNLLSPDVVERRTAIAKMRQLELGTEKDYIALEEKKKNICRIDAALDAIDVLLAELAEVLYSFPDKLQALVPSMNPEEYHAVQEFIDGQMQRLSQKRIHLAIDSTADEMARATKEKNESIQRNQKLKSKKGGK